MAFEQETPKSTAKPGSLMAFLDSYFHISERKSSVRIEVLAGLTTFMTMAYIIILNPIILTAGGATGLNFDMVFVGTCVAAAIATIVMGLYAKYPFALAAGMGLNSVVAYGLILGMGLTWQQAMGIIILEGIIITILVLTNLREMVMNAIPKSLKLAIGAAIGLFIAFIGFYDSKIMVANPVTLIQFGNLANPFVMVAILTLFIIIAMMALKIRGSILYGIIISSVLALAACLVANQMGYAFNAYGVMGVPSEITALPAGLSNVPAGITAQIVEIPDVGGFVNVVVEIVTAIPQDLKLSLIPVILAIMMVDFFDTMGTVVAVADKGNLLDKSGKLPKLNRVLLVDSLAAVTGGLFGASSNTSYVESASGVAAGGRTGLASVVVGLLFLVALFFVPLGYIVPTAAAAPALIIVGYLMITSIKDIAWDRVEDALPAFITIVTMVFTFSISKGIGAGFITYVVVKVFTGKWKDIHPLMWLAAIMFALYFVYVSVFVSSWNL
ncbi:MAG: Permease family protein [Methanocella sp. PtaU1.Bin125]|nr:MAG: Permease family protein [Methanocella sp. PtaU1.Bin125]